jgi:hypothetical protein
MKIRLVVALVGLAISFAVPAFAQQKDATDSQIRQQLDTLGQKYDEVFNNGDAAALVTDTGLVYGREAIERYYADLFKQIHISNQFGKSDEYSPHIIGTAGNELWSNGEWSLTYRVNGGGPGPIRLKGYWSNIYLREGDAWKTRMGMSSVTP